MSDVRAGTIEVWDNVQQMPMGAATATPDTARLARPPGAWAHSGLPTPGYSRSQQGFSGSFGDTDRLPLAPSRLVSATIGRDMSNDLVLRDQRVSRAHAVLVSTPAGVEIRDINSRNGTFINGARIGRALLRSGDFITIGTTEFAVEFSGSIRLPAEALGILSAGRIRHSPYWTVGHARYARRPQGGIRLR
ncbi:FHA domain-containing protein [Mycobacterium interjectum]|uniref:FHA domain-containing protein n=1 Tax=Mycobacterium interjectum TaxID=33895 RepID=UPI001B3C62F5|nr:FHA domain-containing protein [Mycobacterium interjectum]MCV7090046.1 FHA domain-containing protein [Mycobacterium interjectum]